MTIPLGSRVICNDRFGGTETGEVSGYISDKKGHKIAYYVKLDGGYIMPCVTEDVRIIDEDSEKNHQEA